MEKDSSSSHVFGFLTDYYKPSPHNPPTSFTMLVSDDGLSINYSIFDPILVKIEGKKVQWEGERCLSGKEGVKKLDEKIITFAEIRSLKDVDSSEDSFRRHVLT